MVRWIQSMSFWDSIATFRGWSGFHFSISTEEFTCDPCLLCGGCTVTQCPGLQAAIVCTRLWFFNGLCTRDLERSLQLMHILAQSRRCACVLLSRRSSSSFDSSSTSHPHSITMTPIHTTKHPARNSGSVWTVQMWNFEVLAIAFGSAHVKIALVKRHCPMKV